MVAALPPLKSGSMATAPYRELAGYLGALYREYGRAEVRAAIGENGPGLKLGE